MTLTQHAIHTFTLLSGETVTVEMTPEIDAYIARLRAMAVDTSIGLQPFIDALYHEDNPALVKGVIPGRGLVTTEVLRSPVWAVMSDIEQQKLIATGLQTPFAEQAEAFTMSAADAARQLGITPNAVRMASKEERLAGRKIANRWMVLPSSVDAYAVSVRGPGNKLECTIGHVKGFKASLRFDESATLTRLKRTPNQPQSVVRGHLSDWHWAVLLTQQSFQTDSGMPVQTTMLRVLVPDNDAEPNEIGHERFMVRGRFRVLQKTGGDNAEAIWTGDIDTHVASLKTHTSKGTP